MVVGVNAGDVAYWALAAFLVLVGLGLLFSLVKLGELFSRIASFIRGTERDLLPVLVKAGGTVDRINFQLDKADTVTDSAVAMADSADTAVRAVSYAIAKPVEKLSGVAAGLSNGISSLRRSRDVHDALSAFKDAARRREDDLAADLRGVRTPTTAERPEPVPPSAPKERPVAVPRPVPVERPAPAPVPPEDPLPPAA